MTRNSPCRDLCSQRPDELRPLKVEAASRKRSKRCNLLESDVHEVGVLLKPGTAEVRIVELGTLERGISGELSNGEPCHCGEFCAVEDSVLAEFGSDKRVRLSEKHHIVGCFGYAARLRRSMVSSS